MTCCVNDASCLVVTDFKTSGQKVRTPAAAFRVAPLHADDASLRTRQITGLKSREHSVGQSSQSIEVLPLCKLDCFATSNFSKRPKRPPATYPEPASDYRKVLPKVEFQAALKSTAEQQTCGHRPFRQTLDIAER